jgi:hypothetical protein
MMTYDPLPTEQQRQMICAMIERAFVELRSLTLEGKSAQASDLADAFHNIPREMFDARIFCWDRFRDELVKYQQKYPESVRTFADFVTMLDKIHDSNSSLPR